MPGSVFGLMFSEVLTRLKLRDGYDLLHLVPCKAYPGQVVFWMVIWSASDCLTALV